MTGLEIVVLAPLAYGILHLGKKVVEQRQIIDNQMETLAQQQLALEAQRAASAAGGNGGGRADTLLGKVVMVGSLGIAGAMTAYNFYRIRSGAGGSDRREQDEEDVMSSQDTTPVTSNTNTLTSSTANDGNNGGNRSSNRSSRHTRRPPENYEPQVAKSETEECKVCLHHQRDTLVTPCNHFSLCWHCAEEIFYGGTARSDSSGTRGVGSCPVCRQPITSLQFAYV